MSLKTKISPVGTDRFAAIIAACILKYQAQIATKLGKWFNAHTVYQKKIMVLDFGIILFFLFSLDILYRLDSLHNTTQAYQPAHIGQASDFPFSKLNKHQLTDSLTKKSQSWKQH